MDKNLARLLGAMGALAVAAPGASASPATGASAMEATSYADLLRPIPNASEILLAANAQRLSTHLDETAPDDGARVQEVQYHDHHHHHHHHHYRRHRDHRPVVVIRPPG